MKDAILQDVLRALNDANALAIKNVVASRIPECGDFWAIAQDLAWVINVLAAQQPAAAQVSGDVVLPEPVGMFAPAGESGDKFPVWHRVQVLAAARTYGQQCSDAALERSAKDTRRLEYMMAYKCIMDQAEGPEGKLFFLSWPYLYEEQSQVFKDPRAAIDHQIVQDAIRALNGGE